MLTPWLAVVAGLVVGAGETPIDTFQYDSDQAAREAWRADERTPPVFAAAGSGETGMRMLVPFETDRQLPRTVLDRRVRLDFSSAGSFGLTLSVRAPESPGRLSLYFRSGDGWYAAGSGLEKGDQQLRFSKAAFNVEGTPAGWQQIDGIRLSVWRTGDLDANVLFQRLVAIEEDVALVIPPAEGQQDGEAQAARQVAERVAEMLDELGLGSDAIDEAAVAAGALGRRKVAVLAYNPRISADAVAALESFAAEGGKVFACYNLPAQLASTLGFQPGEYVRFQPGEIAEIRLAAPDIAGLPASARQASWNITTATPAGHHARVIGRWHDQQGGSTGYPALLISDRGALLTHILLADDRDAKLQMLAAVLGHLEPELWRQMGQAALRRSGVVGPFSAWPEATDWLTSPATRAAARQVAELDRSTQIAGQQRQAMETAFANGDYPGAVKLAQTARQSLRQAYLLAQPSPAREGRAWWNHSGTGAYPGDWERTARELKQNGFNLVIPNLLWAGRAHYPSQVLPRSSTLRPVRRPARAVPGRLPEARCGSTRLESEFQSLGGTAGVGRTAPPRRANPGGRERRTTRLAEPGPSGEPQAGTGEHARGGAQVRCRRLALRLHPLSPRRRGLQRLLPQAVRTRHRPAQSRIGPTTVTGASCTMRTGRGGANRSAGWWRPSRGRRSESSPRSRSQPPCSALTPIAERRWGRIGRSGSRPVGSTSSAPWTTRRATRISSGWCEISSTW